MTTTTVLIDYMSSTSIWLLLIQFTLTNIIFYEVLLIYELYSKSKDNSHKENKQNGTK